MTFIVCLIALLIERFFDWSHLRHWYWFIHYQSYLLYKWHRLSPYMILALSIVPLLLIVALLQFLLQNALYGFVELVFQLLVLLYCLGPQNLWADTFACIHAFTHGDKDFAENKLKTSFGDRHAPSLNRHFLHNIFVASNRRVFAVLFWFVVLGPVGAVLYRTATLSSSMFPEEEIDPKLKQAGRAFETILDWLPVRIFAFIFALGGHFVQVVNCWRKKFTVGLESNEVLLTDCGIAALGVENEAQNLNDGVLEKHAVGLLDRAFVISLLIIAVFVLVI